VIRPATTLLSSNSSSWPQYVLNINAGDILIIFDIRRYEQEMVSLATAARKRGAEIIVFTDQWGSPADGASIRTRKACLESLAAG
ncbi:SIS domain-containing protein, partial [Rhizobium johnstonii]|uniref:SIS domain-containing protein n=1 Tax=Rhizobium johnstonii TaxID=3019933 RepID=UPI003F97C696